MAWAVVATGTWLLLVGAAPRAEVLGGVAAGAITAYAARMVGREMPSRWRLRVGWLRILAPLPKRIVVDTLRLVAVLARSLRADVRGEVVRVEGFGGDDEVAAGRRAVAIVAVSTAPGTVAIDIEDGVMLVHALPGRAAKGLGETGRVLA